MYSSSTCFINSEVRNNNDNEKAVNKMAYRLLFIQNISIKLRLYLHLKKHFLNVKKPEVETVDTGI